MVTSFDFSNLDPQKIVQYVYCILDTISNSVDNLGESNDAELSPLLCRIENIFKYYRFQLFQALPNSILNDFVSWCINRLILIACRPEFCYHLKTVSESIQRLLIMLEQRHVDVFIKQLTYLLNILKSLLLKMKLFDDDECQKEFTFSVQPNVFEKFCTTINLTTYGQTFVLECFHAFYMTIEVVDFNGKQQALDAIFQSSVALMNLIVNPIHGHSFLTYLYAGTAIALQCISMWHLNEFLPNEPQGEDDCSALENSALRCLDLLSALNREGNNKNNELLSEFYFQCNNGREVLNSMCKKLFQSSWIKSMPNIAFKRALLHYMEQIDDKEGDEDSLIGMLCQFDQTNDLEDYRHWAKDMLNRELCRLQIENLIRKQFDSVDRKSIKRIITQYCPLENSDDLDLCQLLMKWQIESHIWGSLPNSVKNELKEDLYPLIDRTFATLLTHLARPGEAKQLFANEQHIQTAYVGLGLLARLIRALSDYTSLDNSFLWAMIDWLKGLVQCGTVQSDLAICVYGPAVHLHTLLLRCYVTVVGPTARVNSGEMATILVELCKSYLVNDGTQNNHLSIWLHDYFDRQLEMDPDARLVDLSIRHATFVKLHNFMQNSPCLSQTNALMLVRLSACVLCSLCRCTTPDRLTARLCIYSCARSTFATTADIVSEKLDGFAFSDHINLLGFLLESRHIDVTADVLVDYAIYIGCHLSWELASFDEIQSFFVLLHTNLPYFTPSIVGKVYQHASQHLSSQNLTSWLTMHKIIVDSLLVGTPPDHGPSSDLSSNVLAEYNVSITSVLAQCLGSHYARLMIDGRLHSAAASSSAAVRSSTDLSIGATQLADALIPAICALCRLGFVHQYSHALFGVVYLELKDCLAVLQMPAAHVLRLCQHQLAQVIVDYMDHSTFQITECLSRLFRVEKKIVFKELSSSLFIALVLRGNQESHLRIRQLVSEISHLRTNQDYVSKIVQLCVLPETFVYIFTRTSKDEQAVHLAFLEAHLNLAIERIAQLNDVSRLMHQFILRLYPYRIGACLGLRWLSSHVLSSVDYHPVSSNALGTTSAKGSVMADFLGHYACGILAFFDNMLLDDDDVMWEHRWIALRSLVVFIQLLGPSHVTRMRAKFMANLKLEPEALCELLPDLGATLVGLLPNDTDQVIGLFHYIFLEKKEEIGSRLSCLFFLPKLPSLLTCHQILDDLCPWRLCSSTFDLPAIQNNQNLNHLLAHWLSALTHSSRVVRKLALTSELASHSLRCFHLSSLVDRILASKWSDSEASAVTSAGTTDGVGDSVDVLDQWPKQTHVLFAKLIGTLLEGLIRDTDDKMRLLYAQWLGNLGAVDPSKLCLSTSDMSDNSSEKNSVVFVSDDRFVFYILCELAKIYLRAASPRQLDSAALAVQELLKLFDVSDSSIVCKAQQLSSATIQQRHSKRNESLDHFVSGLALWNLFPEHLRDLFTPLLTSRYAVEAFTNWSEFSLPIITNQSDLTFEAWIRMFSGSLSTHIKSPVAFKIFQFCEPVVKADASFARLMLEHSALQVLLDNTPDGISQLRTEIMAVLNEANETDPTSNAIDLDSHCLLNASDSNKNSKQLRWRKWYPLAVQTVFGLLDYLRQWLRLQQQQKQKTTPQITSVKSNKATPALESTNADGAIDRVSNFLSDIPNVMQAKASLLCGGLMRALLHWELAYSEDLVASQSAYISGAAVSLHDNNSSKVNGDVDECRTSAVKNRIGTMGVSALWGLLDTYAFLRDSDGLAGVLSVSQLAFCLDKTLSNFKKPPLGTTHQRAKNHTFMRPHSLLRALELENEGQLDMAAAAYEHNLAFSNLDSSADNAKRIGLYSGLFRCELPDPSRLHGLVERAGALVREFGARETSSASLRSRLNAYRAEAAWRLADWETLKETTMIDPPQSSWSVELGRLVLAMKEKNSSQWSSILSQLRISQMTDLCAASLEGPGGYARAYETIVRLSSLSELEMIQSVGQLIDNKLQTTNRCGIDDGGDEIAALESSLNLLEARIKVSRPTFHTLEPVLAIQHTALYLLASSLASQSAGGGVQTSAMQPIVDRLRQALGQNWLCRAQLARKSGQFMAAYSCVLRAESFEVPDALIERAKLLWQTDKREAAQMCLDKGIPDVYGLSLQATKSLSASLGNKTVGAQQAMLLRARYCEETNRFDFETTCLLYQQVCNWCSGCEEAYFRLARYVDKARTQATGSTQNNVLIKSALKHYGLALTYGSEFIYQSMPRLLSLWLDFGSEFARFSHPTGGGGARRTGDDIQRHAIDAKTFHEVQELMLANCNRIPVYQFYTALSQLLSRVCHEVPTVVNTLIDLIVRIFEARYNNVVEKTILDVVNRLLCRTTVEINKRSKKPHLAKYISDCISLCNHLRTICGLFMTTDRSELRNFSLSQTVRPITRLIESANFSRILIPIHNQLVPNLLPAKASADDMAKHWPFGEQSDRLVCLARIDDTVEILGSQTRPKKMTWLGTDGRPYIIVAKPNDDLRKDSRLMELNEIINKFLVKNPETRRRNLQIRTYAVIPLSEKGGIIEWVSKTQPFRSIITRLYSEAGKPINWTNMSRVAPLLEDPLPVKRDKFLNKWLPMFPLIFHNWFLSTFTNPSAWYSARENYARTCAVMSMVGYVLGLGDRHTENILFDSTNGSLVHVDFSCVFNNGLTLPWPERVPFRLTRNMVFAMGPTGYEGIFRRCSQVVMRLLRREIDPLLAVFRPIYFDALVEQGGAAAAGNVRGGPTVSNDVGRLRRGNDCDSNEPVDLADRVTKAATEKLTGMEDRLKGKITEHDGFSQILPMSVEGQVDVLIKEATDVDRLCQMYKGWMPFL